MKRLFVILLFAAVIVLGWLQIRETKMTLTWRDGKVATIKRGGMTIPITATGSIEPKDRFEIKSEAGGRVMELPFEVGHMVKAGDILVRLDPEDEQRLVDIATKALEQSKINEEKARVMVEKHRLATIPSAEARLAGLEADLEYKAWDLEREQGFAEEEGDSSPQRLKLVETAYESTLAQRDAAKAAVHDAKTGLRLSEEDYKQAQLATQRAEDDLADAKERLRETEIAAPVDGMLSELVANKGMVVASGSSSFGGGTPLGRLSDVTSLYVKAQIDESDIGRISEISPPAARPGNRGVLASNDNSILPVETGQTVKVTVEAFADEEFEGVIELVEPEARVIGGVGTYIVRIRIISENAHKLFLGMQASVEFISETVTDAVLVPREAVHYVAGQRGVYVPVPSSKVPDKTVPKFVPFKAGLDNGMFTQVIEGLKEGDRVFIKLPRNRDGEELTGDE